MRFPWADRSQSVARDARHMAQQTLGYCRLVGSQSTGSVVMYIVKYSSVQSVDPIAEEHQQGIQDATQWRPAASKFGHPDGLRKWSSDKLHLHAYRPSPSPSPMPSPISLAITHPSTDRKVHIAVSSESTVPLALLARSLPRVS